MSDIKKSSLVDSTNFGQLISEPASILKNLISGFFEGDEFEGQDVFRAVVISNAVPCEMSEYEALGYPSLDSSMDPNFKKFKVRIIDKRHNPHAVLQDPCDMTQAADLCAQYALISVHTTVVTNRAAGIKIGSLVEIHLDKNSNGTYNLHTAHLIRVVIPNTRGTQILDSSTCKTIRAYHKYGDQLIRPPPIEVTSEIRELAQRYDANEEIPGKHRTAIRISDILIQPHMYHFGPYPQGIMKPYDLWVKAFLQVLFEQGYGEVGITSGTRDAQKQQNMRDRWDSGDREGLVAKPACGICDNPSVHVSGFAIDINFYDKNGKFLTGKGSTKTEWVQSGLPGILMNAPFNLTWGGNFKNEDLVHFELSPEEWGEDAAEIRKQLLETGSMVDTKETGDATTLEQQENMHDALRSEGSDLPAALHEAAAAHDPDALDEDFIGPLTEQQQETRDEYATPDLVGELGDY